MRLGYKAKKTQQYPVLPKNLVLDEMSNFNISILRQVFALLGPL